MLPGHPSTDEFALASPSTDSVARDLIVTQHITIDSVIDATGDWFVPSERDKLELAESHAFTSGIVLLRYRTG